MLLQMIQYLILTWRALGTKRNYCMNLHVHEPKPHIKQTNIQTQIQIHKNYYPTAEGRVLRTVLVQMIR